MSPFHDHGIIQEFLENEADPPAKGAGTVKAAKTLNRPAASTLKRPAAAAADSDNGGTNDEASAEDDTTRDRGKSAFFNRNKVIASDQH
jgi:hypothetical protein